MLDIIQKGGPVMIPILLCSVVALAVAMERVYHYYKAHSDTKKLMTSVLDCIRRNKVKDAVGLCEQTHASLAQILKAGILKYDRTRQEIREAMEDAALHQIPRLEQNLGILGTISHIAPLLGLLGTVTGLVQSFQVIEEKSTVASPINPADLAGGIWEALLTTVAGLTVAIPTIVFYNYFVNRVDRVVNEMEKKAAELLDALTARSS